MKQQPFLIVPLDYSTLAKPGNILIPRDLLSSPDLL